MGGSFLASTANSVVFGNGIDYSAINPQVPPLLTMSVPVGLQYGKNPGNIINQSQSGGEQMLNTVGLPVGLMVQENQTLALVGGDVILDGGNLTAFGGRIEIGSVKDGGFVSIKPDLQGWQLGYDKVQSFGNIEVVDRAGFSPDANSESIASVVDASGYYINNWEVLNTSLTNGVNESDNLFNLSEVQRINNGQIDKIQIYGILSSFNYSYNDLNTVDAAAFFNNQQRGTIQIQGRSLSVQNSAITSSNFSQARTIGSSVNINISESIQLSGNLYSPRFDSLIPAGIFAQTQGVGQGGDLSIRTNRLIVNDGAQVSVDTFGSGNAGTLTVNAIESVELNNAGLFAQIQPLKTADGQLLSATGKGGNLTINTQRLTLLNGGQVGASTFSQGDAGSVKINATEVLLNGEERGISPNGETIIFSSGIYSQSNPSAPENPTGAGGNVSIDTKRLIVQNGAQVSVITSSDKNGGNLIINAELVQLSGQRSDGRPTRLIAETQEKGNAGDLMINSRQLVIENGATVTVSGQKPTKFTPDFLIGNAGTLTINANDIRLTNGAIRGEAVSGRGGNIRINTNTLVGVNNSDISAIAGAPGNFTQPGEGGKIEISYQGLFGLRSITRNQAFNRTNGSFNLSEINSNDIAAFSVTNPNLNGQIIFNSPEVDQTTGAIKTPQSPAPIGQIARGCETQPGQNTSSFINTGTGGLPPNPSAPLMGVSTWQDFKIQPQQNTGLILTQTNSNPIIEAQGFEWANANKTRIKLTANSRNVTPSSSWQIPGNCYGK